MSTMMKKRTNISEENKEPFLSIMKTSDGGRFWKTIVVGDGDVTYQDRHNSWVAVAKQFSEVMVMEFTPKQFKDVWFRIKASKKIRHDSMSQFKEDCAKTGGGSSPNLPSVMDGDDYCV